MSKYDELPDIDLQSNDVFETSDVEEEIENDGPPLEKHESLDEIETSVNEARMRFENEVIEGVAADFSGRIDRNPSYTTYRVHETTEQKLNRIKRELNEIELLREKGDMDENIPVFSDLLAKLSVERKKILPISYGVELTNETETTSLPIVSDPKIAGNIVELESRLNRLEKLLGVDVQESSQTIQAMINDMNKKVNIVYNPEYSLEKVKSYIENINNQTESAINSRKFHKHLENPDSIPESSLNEEEIIDDLYTKSVKLDNLSSILPSVISRLKALHGIHSDIGSTVQLGQEIGNIVSGLNLDMKKWNESLVDMGKRLESADEQFETNKKEIRKWIDDLNEKVGNKDEESNV